MKKCGVKTLAINKTAGVLYHRRFRLAFTVSLITAAAVLLFCFIIDRAYIGRLNQALANFFLAVNPNEGTGLGLHLKIILVLAVAGIPVALFALRKHFSIFRISAHSDTNAGAIADTRRKIEELIHFLEDTEVKLASNPADIAAIRETLERLYREKNAVTETENALKLIKAGESKNVEFKQTLRHDVANKGIKEKALEEAVLKNVVAFLNTDGGFLFIGIKDNGEITGVDNELTAIAWTMDKYLAHLSSLFRERIGADFYPFIDHKYLCLDEKKIIKISCIPSTKPCYLDNEAFYVRTNPAANRLEGPKLVAYIKNHFG
jgi:hypothetical protein